MKPGKMTAFLIAATFTFGTEVAAIDKSKGVYRIPYSNGTKVKVTNNHDKHKPKGRIDMHGTGGASPTRLSSLLMGACAISSITRASRSTANRETLVPITTSGSSTRMGSGPSTLT